MRPIETAKALGVVSLYANAYLLQPIFDKLGRNGFMDIDPHTGEKSLAGIRYALSRKV